jgi:hypothetical protein
VRLATTLSVLKLPVYFVLGTVTPPTVNALDLKVASDVPR